MSNRKSLIISETEKSDIRELYGLIPIKRNYIFEASVSSNGRYFIIHDEVFDIQEQKTIGNLWGSIDVFKTIFQNTILDNSEYAQIRESVLSLPILEGKETLYGLRDILLEWNFFDNTWVGGELKKAGQGIKDFATTSYQGLKDFGIAISQGDWKNVLSLLAKGVKYLLRELKSALYSTVGMLVDAILVASGIGLSVQWIPWAMVTALDVYQISTNDWPPEESALPTWAKFLTLGFDILGLVLTSAAAKAAKVSLNPLIKMGNNTGRISQYLSKNPKLKNIIESMIKGINKVPKMLSNAQSFLIKKFPNGAKFISGILGKLSGVLKTMEESLSKLIGKTPARIGMATATTGGLLYGIDKVSGNKTTNKTNMGDLEQSLKSTNIEPEFDFNDI